MAREPKELKQYTFRVRGHGHDIPGVQVEAESEQKAVKEALKACKPFSLPGWELFCVETGTSQAIAEFIDPSANAKVRA